MAGQTSTYMSMGSILGEEVTSICFGVVGIFMTFLIQNFF
jgi:hypothetical protein